MSSYSRQQLEVYLKTIDVKGSVLDIGGSVQTLEGRVKSFNPTKYLIMDNGSEEGLHDKWIEPNIKWDINDPMSGNELNNNFDQIFMIEVSEYLYDPYMALLNIKDMLKNGGEFYSSWHFIIPQHPPKGKDFLRYTPACLDYLFEKAGFEIIENIPRVTEVVDLREVWSAEKMRGWKEFNNSIIGSIVKCRKR